jgi:Cellulase (glycosyl hydrolase family 5)
MVRGLALVWRLALAAAVGVLAAGGIAAPAFAEPGTGGDSCHHVTGPFGVKNGYMVTGNGHRFVPYGINLTGIKVPRYVASVAAMEAEEDAAASAWCANVVRFGVDEDRLIHGWRPNQAYLDAVGTVVAHAESDGLAVVLAMSRGYSGVPSEWLPTWKTKVAWRVIARRFASDQQVIFEIYNEPRHVTWEQWRNGNQSYGFRQYGMEAMAKWLRYLGAKNLLWVDGIMSSSRLDGIPEWHLSGVGPVAYAEHHPPGDTAMAWTSAFGFLAGYWPVVDGEWTNYSRSHALWACWPNAPVSVPAFLKYLAKRGIGMVAFDLARPRLIVSSDLGDASYFHKDWACVTGLHEGAGHQIMQWFWEHNSRIWLWKRHSGPVR